MKFRKPLVSFVLGLGVLPAVGCSDTVDENPESSSSVGMPLPKDPGPTDPPSNSLVSALLGGFTTVDVPKAGSTAGTGIVMALAYMCKTGKMSRRRAT
jgi:hypothetical protein